MEKVFFKELSTSQHFEVLEHVFNGLDDICRSVEVMASSGLFGKPDRKIPEVEIPGVHILELYEMYPCFDSYDCADEDRFFRNYFFSSKPFTDEDLNRLRNIKQSGNFCLVNEHTPIWALPAIYYRGEGTRMILATIESYD